MSIQTQIDRINEAVGEQANLIEQIKVALAAKAAGISGATFDIIVTVESGATVSATQGDTVVSGTSNGSCTLNVNKTGTWTITAVSSDNEESDIQTITIDDTFDTSLAFWRAYIAVNTQVGVAVTCSNGSKTYNKTADSETIIFKVNDTGTWTITATLDGETESTQVSVSSQTTYNVDILQPKPAVDSVLNNNDWATIGEVSDADQGANYWAVGDAKQVNINGTIGNTAFSNVKLWAFILGFNHNSSREGTHRIHFQLGRSAQTGGNNLCLIGSVYNAYSATAGAFAMNPAANYSSSTNAGGWKSCKMRTVVLGSDKAPTSPTSNSYVAALPSDLRAVMKSVTKYSDNTGGGSNTASYVTATTDYLPLPAEFEVFGSRSYANSAEQNYQQQYDYYKNGNSKIFYQHKATTTAASWWLRSVDAASTAYFCRVATGGSADVVGAGRCGGVAPVFCV